ncbi:MAG: DUF58 domain-containing protein [Acetobacter okinawensis]|uniref:DUF58 domain-containing protein n=1 Tax=Acetobacter okinawensis TaxID=1076594 RepID=UPI0039ECBCCD
MSRSRLLPNTLLRWFYGVDKPTAGGPRTTGSTTTSPPVATADVACAAQALAMRMPDLLLHASQMATTLASGLHPQRRAGWGDTFWQYRPAQPGEPANRIDWRQSARTTRAHVRETEAEAAQTVLLWCDLSGSMQWRSAKALPGKLDRAVLLLLGMAALLLRNGERVHLLSPAGIVPLPPAPSALERLALGLCGLAASDLLCPDAALDDCLRQLAAHPVRTHVLHISDPAENTLPYSGRTEFSGLEDEPTLELPHVQSLRADYTNLVTARARWLEQTIGRTGHTLTRHQTDMAPLPTLLALHAQMSQRV